MSRFSFGMSSFCMTALVAAGMIVQPGMGQEKNQEKNKDKFEKAGNATEEAAETAGSATEEGLEAAGKGTGAAVEHTGRGVTTAAKATAGAMESTGEAIADFFDGDDESDSDRVKEVQRALQANGYYSGPIDGVVGPKTKSGVREYQRDQNMKVTGKVDEKTAQSLGVS